MIRILKRLLVATRESWTQRRLVRPRSSQWIRVKREHLVRENRCQWCGGIEDLRVHHIMPVHLYPELELDEKNLITLCGDGCHLEKGHNGDWRKWNKEVREQCFRFRG